MGKNTLEVTGSELDTTTHFWLQVWRLGLFRRRMIYPDGWRRLWGPLWWYKGVQVLRLKMTVTPGHISHGYGMYPVTDEWTDEADTYPPLSEIWENALRDDDE